MVLITVLLVVPVVVGNAKCFAAHDLCKQFGGALILVSNFFVSFTHLNPAHHHGVGYVNGEGRCFWLFLVGRK
uniref:Putative secreted protein n=1 Tax=Anopheles marajoara TaxID=58244 RepID=A0A2M4CDP9_9DIPT